MNKPAKKPKVLVGMSGGVDSSVAAALLKKQGYDVIGIFLRFWKDASGKGDFENKCCSLDSLENARRTANILKIPLYTVNAEKEFKKKVADYFLKTSAKGETPNPCVVCNKEIKFKILLEKMLAMGAKAVATGHYARVKQKPGTGKKREFELRAAEDKEKDQSYFLYRLEQKELSRIIFPLGNFKKSETRRLAKKFNLPVHDKKESQNLCFIREDVPDEFLKRNLKIRPGKIVDENGKELGIHRGLPLYTLGQRRGLNVGGRGPYFAAEKDFRRNRLIATNDPGSPKLFRKDFLVKEISWTNNTPQLPLEARIGIRYRQKPIRGIIKKTASGSFKVFLEKRERAITPGQSAVFYGSEGKILGGGIIS